MIRVPDIASTLEPAEHLLVITPPGGNGRYGLWLPFGDATLVEAGPDGIPADELPERPVDGVVIESPAADVSWADRILGELNQVISETSTVVVAFVLGYASVTGANDSPPDLKTLHDFRVVHIGLLGGAVSLVLSRCVGASPPAEADAAMVASTTSLALELESLARGRQPQSAAGQRADRAQAATIFQLRDEVHRLSAALASTEQELKKSTRQYRALRYSRLGQITVTYWRFRRKLAARVNASGLREPGMRRLIRLLVRIETVAVLVTAWLAGALGLGLAAGAGVVPTVGLMALGPLLGGLLLQVRHSGDLARRIDDLVVEASAQGRGQQTLAAAQSEQAAELGELRASVAALPGPMELDAAMLKGTLDTTRRVQAAIEKEIKHTFHQLEALQNLNAVLPTNEVLPATRGWAASPDLLVVLVDLVITGRPSLVVECGSGASTLWLALAMRRFGIDGRIIALDHDPVFADKTRAFLTRHDVRDLAEVRDAPLESFNFDGGTYSWYARQAWEDLTGIDLLFVDGPPAATGHQARYPALPLLRESLSPVATIVLDDLVVPDMQKVLQLWLDAYPEFGSEILALEKRAAVLRRS